MPHPPEEFIAITMRMADLTIHYEQIVKTRKVLTPEQFRDDRAREPATKHFLTGLMERFIRIFAGMMDRGMENRITTYPD